MQPVPGNIKANILPFTCKHYLLLFVLFFAATVLIYLPTLHAKFVADFIDMVFYLKSGPSLASFAKGVQFDFVNWAVFKTWLYLFGYNAWAWHFLQCFLHALNGLLLYAMLGVMFNHFQYKHYGVLALTSTLCFLFSPYHTEPVAWGGDINYLLVTCFIFLHLLAFTLFLQRPERKYLFVAVPALVAAVFSHELGWLLIPADIILVFVFANSFKEALNRNTLKFLGISVAVMVLYFANKLYAGDLIGHYGAGVHLRFHFKELLSATYKYLVKILFLGSFFPSAFLQKTYSFIGRTGGLIAFSIPLIIAILLVIKSYKTNKGLKASIGLFLLFGLFLFPVLNLYFPYWIKIDGDRYCYITSAFLLASCISALNVIRPALSFLFAGIYLVGALYFLSFNIESWHRAGNIETNLEKEFRWQNAPHVYILNLPDDYRGAYIYRSLRDPNLFVETFIKYGPNLPDTNKVIPVLRYNLNSPTDSVKVQVMQNDSLNVTLSVWGTWWWGQVNGDVSYQDSLVNVHVSSYGNMYGVKFKRKQVGDVFIYCANGHWQQVPGF